MAMKSLLYLFLVWGAMLLLVALAVPAATALRAPDTVLAGLYGTYMTLLFVAPLALACLALSVWAWLHRD